MSERIFGAAAALCARRPRLVLVVCAVLTVLSAWASAGMKIDTSAEGMLADSLPFKKVEREYRADFPRSESLVIVVDASTGADADSAADNLAVRLQDKPELFTEVEVPGESDFFRNNGLLYLDPPKLDSFLDSLDTARPALQLFARDPSLRGIARLVSNPRAGGRRDDEQSARMFTEFGETATALANNEDRRVDWLKIFAFERPGARPGTRRFVVAKPVVDNTSLDRAEAALDALNEEIKGVYEEEAEGVKINVTGDPALRQQELDDAFSGAVAASSLSFILVALSLVLGVRSGRLIVAMLITLVIGGIWTTGLAAIAVGQLNLISIAFMVLFFGLGVDFGTHMGLRFLEERKAGLPFEEALREAMIHESAGIGLSTVCAMLAFLSFVPTPYTGLAEFGIISALGMVVAFVVTFTLQPALMAIMPPKVPSWGEFHIGIGGFIKRYHVFILLISTIVTIATLYFAASARIDVNPLNLQDPNAPPVRTYRDLARDPETSPYSLNVIARTLDEAHERAEKLKTVPGVADVVTAEQFLPGDQAEKLRRIAETRRRLGANFMNPDRQQDPPNEAQLRQAFSTLLVSSERIAASAPENSELRTAAEKFRDGMKLLADKRGTGAEDLQAYNEAFVGSLPDLVSGLRERLSVNELKMEDLPEEIARDWLTGEGHIRLQIQPANDLSSPEALENFARAVQAVEPAASGVPASVTGAGDAILWSFTEAVLYTALSIGLVVIFLRRRVDDVILILAPLVIAAIWTVAGSALLDLPFNFANVIVIPLLIGLGVAGSVQIVIRTRHLAELNRGKKPRDRVSVLDTSTSLAVLVAQLNTVAAFATLAVSNHRGLYSMGMLLGLAILLVVIACLVVLPAALIALHRRTA